MPEKNTFAAGANPEPFTVTRVPPSTGPALGATWTTFGGAASEVRVTKRETNRSPSVSPEEVASSGPTLRKYSVPSASAPVGTTSTTRPSTFTSVATTRPRSGSPARSTTVPGPSEAGSTAVESSTRIASSGGATGTCPARLAGSTEVTSSRCSGKLPSRDLSTGTTAPPTAGAIDALRARFACTSVVAVPSAFTTEAESRPLTGLASWSISCAVVSARFPETLTESTPVASRLRRAGAWESSESRRGCFGFARSTTARYAPAPSQPTKARSPTTETVFADPGNATNPSWPRRGSRTS